MSKNPYVKKFSKAFNFGLALVVFLVLVVLVFFPKSANSAITGDLPVTCLTVEEFSSEYQSGSFEIINKSSVVIFVEGEPYKIDKIITQGKEGKETIEGLWLVENTGKFCLVYLQNIGQVHKL